MEAETYINLVDTAMENAENNISKISHDIIVLNGNVGLKTKHFYNNLLNFPNAKYLDIGSWTGSSVCSAIHNNSADIVCIDNWLSSGDTRLEFMLNLEKFKGENNVTILEADYDKVNTDCLRNFNILIYDGDHSVISHDKILPHYYDALSDIFILVVDDWNMKNIRDQVLLSISRLNLKTLHQRAIRLTWDDSFTRQPYAANTWWNGMYVAVLQKQ